MCEFRAKIPTFNRRLQLAACSAPCSATSQTFDEKSFFRRVFLVKIEKFFSHVKKHRSRFLLDVSFFPRVKAIVRYSDWLELIYVWNLRHSFLVNISQCIVYLTVKWFFYGCEKPILQLEKETRLEFSGFILIQTFLIYNVNHVVLMLTLLSLA